MEKGEERMKKLLKARGLPTTQEEFEAQKKKVLEKTQGRKLKKKARTQ